MAFEENPWSDEFWNLTQQGAYIKQFGVEVAKTKARQAGTKLYAARKTAPKPELRVLVQRRNLVVGGGTVGGLPADALTSGDGPPT